MKIKRDFRLLEMNYLCIIFASILSVGNSDVLSNDILQYFKSDPVKFIRLTWDDHRSSVEHSLGFMMQNSIGKDGLNKVKSNITGFRLTRAYYLTRGRVNLILRNLSLVRMPYCWIPDALLSLASNVLKIETELTKMLINAEYMLMRNKSDIFEGGGPDQQKRTPFLYNGTLNIGQLTLSVDSCKLSGYVITKLKNGTVHLGHENFTLTNCQYTVMMSVCSLLPSISMLSSYDFLDWSCFNFGELSLTNIHNNDSTKVKAEFYNKHSSHSLGIEHYLLMTLREEFLQKLQAAVISSVNISAIFGQNHSSYEAAQEDIFARTSSNLTALINAQNQKFKSRKGGIVKLADYIYTWDYWDSSFYNEISAEPVTIKLHKMVLTGLDTAYNSNTGGPFKFDTAMIGEQMRFSRLNVTGALSLTSRSEANHINFSIEISDFAVNTEISIDDAAMNSGRIEVVGYRDIKFSQPELVTGPIETFITSYVKNEVSKAVIKNIVHISMMPYEFKKNKSNLDLGVIPKEPSRTWKGPTTVSLNETYSEKDSHTEKPSLQTDKKVSIINEIPA